MIPVSDAVRSRRFPFVNVAVILACVVVFVYELTLSDVHLAELFRDWGAVPRELNDWAQEPSGVEEPATALSSAFLHGGWLHLLGNMIYLWVFGDNVEDALGHLRYALFYVVCAAAAVVAQVVYDPDTTVPMIGASGAIAGVLGGYLVLYPRARVQVVIPPFIIFVFAIPAVALIVFWFVMQLFTGLATVGAESQATQDVAVWAHVGGFLAGLAIMLVARRFVPRQSLSQLHGRRRGW